jgi:hypothetical protein
VSSQTPITLTSGEGCFSIPDYIKDTECKNTESKHHIKGYTVSLLSSYCYHRIRYPKVFAAYAEDKRLLLQGLAPKAICLALTFVLVFQGQYLIQQ